MAVLKDALGATQPVTTMPELGKSIIGGAAYRFVYVGTGLYLGNTDVATTQTQTMYGLVDPKTRENSTQNNPLYGSTTPGPADPLYTSALPSGSLPPNVNVATPLRSNLVQQSLTTSGTTRTASTNPVDLTVKNGWYIDLNLAPAGERINTTPVLAYGVLMFTANIPSATVCVPGGSSWFYALNSITGGAYTNPTTGTLASAATFLGNALASRPVLIQLPSGKVAAVVHMSGDTTSSPDASILTGGGGGAAGVPPPQPPATPGKRVSWRELVQ